MIYPIYIGEDHDVTFDGAKAVGNYLNSGTCTYQLKDADGTVVSSGTCTYVVASDGNYAGTIESTVTVGLVKDAYYTVEMTFVQAPFNGFRRLFLQAQYREAA